MIKIAILGSTGSIGTQTLDIVRKNKDLQVLGLAAGRKDVYKRQQLQGNIKTIREQGGLFL